MIQTPLKQIRKAATLWRKRLRTGDRGVLALAIGLGSILASIIAFIGLYARPIADDYAWLYQARSMSFLQYMHQQLWYAYGRYSNALALDLIGKLFKDAAVMVTPLILIIILISSAYYALRVFNIAANKAMAIALLAITLLLASAPSIFDTVYWFNSSTLYPIAIAGSMMVAGITLQIWSTDVKPARLLLLCALAVFAGGFNEIAPVINLIIIALICAAWNGKTYPLRRYAISALAATQVFALVVLKYAPGSLHRQNLAQSGTSTPLHTVKQSFLAMGDFISSLHIWHFILILATSVVLALILYTPISAQRISKSVWQKVTALITLSIVFFVIPVGLTLYAHSIRDDGQPPYRAQIYLIAGMILGFTTILWVICRAINLQTGALRNVLLITTLCLAGTLALNRIAETGQAVSTRSFLYDQRKVIADLQLEAGNKALALPQVPLYAETDASDLPLSNNPEDTYSWVSKVLADYLGADKVMTDNSKSIRQCPAHGNWYTNYQYCDSIYKSIKQ